MAGGAAAFGNAKDAGGIGAEGLADREII